jgi:hypothetical protein
MLRREAHVELVDQAQAGERADLIGARVSTVGRARQLRERLQAPYK